jgi:hypothetical protein
MFYMSARLVVLAIAYIHTYYVLYIYILNILYLCETLNLIDMRCKCGAGYCPDDNLTYPCVCEPIEDFKPDPVPEFLLDCEEDEEDDLPF